MTSMMAVDKLYQLCNRYQWFTHGTNYQYEKMFSMTRGDFSLKDIAVAIWICSEGYKFENIYEILKKEIKSIEQ